MGRIRRFGPLRGGTSLGTGFEVSNVTVSLHSNIKVAKKLVPGVGFCCDRSGRAVFLKKCENPWDSELGKLLNAVRED